MEKLKSNWLRAITALTVMLTVILGVNALEMSNKTLISNTEKQTSFVFVLNPGGDPENPADYTYSPTGTSCDLGTKICAVSNQHDATLTQSELDMILAGEEGRVYWKN